MREILFRGKAIGGDWAYGYYVFTPKRTGAFGQTISSADFDRHYILTMKFNIVKEVIPETVGQYTGLTDKNGKRIFEGDIVVQPVRETSKHSPCIVEFHKGKFQAHYVSKNRFFDRYYDVNSYTKVIGNIHDNPELLKGGADE